MECEGKAGEVDVVGDSKGNQEDRCSQQDLSRGFKQLDSSVRSLRRILDLG